MKEYAVGWFALALIGVFVHVVIAQSGVTGRVVDTAGQPLPGVSSDWLSPG